MKSITVRGIDSKLQTELEKFSKKEHKSLNKTILFLISKGLGLEEQIKYPIYNDLDYLAGSWTKEDEKAFKKATSQFSEIEKDLWK